MDPRVDDEYQRLTQADQFPPTVGLWCIYSDVVPEGWEGVVEDL